MEQNGTLFRLGSLVHPPDSGPESAFPGGRKETPAIRIAAPAAPHPGTAARPALRCRVP